MTQTAKANLAPVSPAEGPAGGETAVTWEQVESYLDSLSSRGRTAGTITAYRRSLKRFYRDLPEDKRVDRETISRWRTALLEGGYTARTVNAHLSAAYSRSSPGTSTCACCPPPGFWSGSGPTYL